MGFYTIAMSNTIGILFRVTTFGESHGPALGCVVDGCPPKIPLNEKDIQVELDRRRPGQSRAATQRKEPDRARILSGVFKGKTLGTPIAMIVENTDTRSADYEKIKNIFRPGHADFTWDAKYGIRDYRGAGRASGRETVGRVMAGAVAKKILNREKIKIYAYAIQIGAVKSQKTDLSFIEKNPVRCADPSKAQEMELCIENAKNEGDSVGGIVELVIKNAPAGLGEPVFDKLSADLAKALTSIPSVKGIEFGSGFACALKKGSEQNDSFAVVNKKIIQTKNDAGGLLGGISTGADIVLRLAIKPPSSIAKTQKTVTASGKPVNLRISGRHDPCIVPRLIPVAESMAAIVTADNILSQRRLYAII